MAAQRSILFVHSSDELYGADRMLLELIGAVPDDVTAEVWLPTDLVHPGTPLCDELRRRGVSVRHRALPILRRAYRRPRALAGLAVRTVRTAIALRRAKPHLVYCTTSATYLVIAAARLARVRTVVGHVQEIWSAGDTRVLAPLARRADGLIAISGAVARALPDALAARTVVITNASPDPGPVESVADREGPLRYLIASRWNGWKGHRTLLAAWDAAGCPGKLTVLGAMPPSGESVDVASLAAGLSRPESVEIVGEVDDIGPFVRAADVMVVPSDDPEPFGLVAIEAFAAGRPVLASRGGGLADIVTDGVDGWLFEPRDVDGLCDRLTQLRRSEVVRAAGAARRTYEQQFTTARYVAQWQETVGRLLARD